jgi:hypothetical protein
MFLLAFALSTVSPADACAMPRMERIVAAPTQAPSESERANVAQAAAPERLEDVLAAIDAAAAPSPAPAPTPPASAQNRNAVGADVPAAVAPVAAVPRS